MRVAQCGELLLVRGFVEGDSKHAAHGVDAGRQTELTRCAIGGNETDEGLCVDQQFEKWLLGSTHHRTHRRHQLRESRRGAAGA